MRWLDVRQLKNLRRFPVPPELLAAGRVKLIAVIEASPMAARPSAWFVSAALRPMMAAMVVIVVVTGGGTVAAAHDALPGEKLYVVKLAAEGVSERMALGPERRFVVQAAHATRRLEETERLLDVQEIDGDDRAERVRAAMVRYEDHVFAMNEIAVKIDDASKKPARRKRSLGLAEGMVERHVRLIESATGAAPALAAAMFDPIDASFSLEADVSSVMPADDGGEDDRERRQGERERRFGVSLKRISEELGRQRRDAGRGEDAHAGDRD